jgi:hypothetical protein
MNAIIAKPKESSLSFAVLISEYSEVLTLRVLAYRWLAEAAHDEALKSIYTTLWQSVAGARYAWSEVLAQWGFVGLVPRPQHEWLDVLQANASLPPSVSGLEALMDWVNELDDRQAQLGPKLSTSVEVPDFWRAELARYRQEWNVLRGPLRYLTQYAHQFI